MKIYLDTNVIIDFLLNRGTFADDAEKILLLGAESNDEYEFVSSSTTTDICYITSKNLKIPNEKIQEIMSKLFKIVDILSVSKEEINYALNLKWDDFEDAVQYATCKANNIDIIITRNDKDYSKSEIKVLSPKQFIEEYSYLFENLPTCNELLDELTNLRDER